MNLTTIVTPDFVCQECARPTQSPRIDWYGKRARICEHCVRADNQQIAREWGCK